MPNPIETLCPQCRKLHGTLFVLSTTVMTLTCPRCAHTWSVDLATLSLSGRQELAAALRKRGD